MLSGTSECGGAAAEASGASRRTVCSVGRGSHLAQRAPRTAFPTCRSAIRSHTPPTCPGPWRARSRQSCHRR